MRLALLFLILGLPLVAVSWLGWRLLQQDQSLGEQQQRQQLENTATLIARALEARLQEIEQRLGADPSSAAEMLPDAAVLRLSGHAVRGREGRALPYYPSVAVEDASPALFASAEAVEFRDRDLRRAAAMYATIASTSDSRVRAAALVRQARVLRRDQRVRDALDVYSALARLEGTWVAGLPAELVARRERAELLQRTGRRDEAARESQALAALLDSARYTIDRETFTFFSASAGGSRSLDREAVAMSAAVASWWPRWPLEPSGRMAGLFDGQPLVMVWRRAEHTPADGAAVVAPAASVMTTIADLIQDLPVDVRIEDEDGAVAWGETLPDGTRVSVLARESRLPWTVHVAPSDSRAAEGWPAAVDCLPSGWP